MVQGRWGLQKVALHRHRCPSRPSPARSIPGQGAMRRAHATAEGSIRNAVGDERASGVNPVGMPGWSRRCKRPDAAASRFGTSGRSGAGIAANARLQRRSVSKNLGGFSGAFGSECGKRPPDYQSGYAEARGWTLTPLRMPMREERERKMKPHDFDCYGPGLRVAKQGNPAALHCNHAEGSGRTGE